MLRCLSPLILTLLQLCSIGAYHASHTRKVRTCRSDLLWSYGSRDSDLPSQCASFRT